MLSTASSNEVVVETPRLTVRRWLAADLGPLLAIYGDPEAMRWVGDGRPISENEAVRWLAVTANNYRVRGYGMFAVVLKGSDLVVGFCGLVHPGGQSEAEVKYAFGREYWGRGYATEVVSALLSYGAGTFGLGEVISTVAEENVASHRVLEKAGMHRTSTRRNDDESLTALYTWRPAVP
jgi:RimJ/RimL family protein N-acetyltransferase